MNNTTMHRTVLALLSALALVPASSFAQVRPAAAAGSKQTRPQNDTEQDETVVLSPFEVSTLKDKGYRATNSTAGTRLNVSIKDLPLNLEVITSQFIQDTGATDLRQALRYSAGVVLESQSDAFVETDSDPQSAGANDPRGATRTVGDSTTKLRGFVISQVLRDGFRRVYSADSIDIDRIEVLRGPSALLYGVGSFGGVINYLPKKPLLTEKYSTAISVGTDDYFRGEFDFTGPMGNGPWKPAYRITGSYQEGGDQTEFYSSKHWSIDPVFSFHPFENTTVSIDNEFGHLHQSGVGFQNVRSNLGTGASRTANWITDAASGAINTRTFRWSGPDTFLKGPIRNTVIDITQKISDQLYIRAGIDNSRIENDSRQVSDTSAIDTPFVPTVPGNYTASSMVTLNGTAYGLRDALTQANANGTFQAGNQSFTPFQIYQNRPPGSYRGDTLVGFIANDPVEKQIVPGSTPNFTDSGSIRYDWIDDNKVENRNQIRTDLNYKLDLGAWGKHNFVAGLQYQKVETKEDKFGPGYSFANHPVADVNRFSFHNPGDYGYIRYGIQGDGRPDAARVKLNHYLNDSWDLGFYGVYQGQFFNDRLTIIGGARRDRDDQRGYTYYDWEGGRAPDVSDRYQNSKKAPSATSPQIGLSYAISRNFTVFGLYSTGVVPNYSAVDGNGVPFAPTKAKNLEAGLKFDVLEGRISGTISAFKIKRTGTPKNLWWAPAPYKNALNGYDASKVTKAVWSYASPDAVWYGIQKVGVAAAKKVLPSGFWSTIDAMAAIPAGANQYTPGAGFNDIPGVKRWWDNSIDASGQRGLIQQAAANTNAGSTANGIYNPLIDFSNPDVSAFIVAAKRDFHGWGGNFDFTRGQTYYGADGTAGTGNAPDQGGASVPLDDEAKGWDTTVVANVTDDLQMTFNFAHVKRKITSKTYKFVKAPYYPVGVWYVRDGNYGTLSYTRDAKDAYSDITDTSTYNVVVPEYAQSADDTPSNTATTWLRYSMDHAVPVLKGLTFGLGGEWEDKRLWFTGFTGGGGNIDKIYPNGDTTLPPQLVQLWTKTRYSINALVEYRMILAEKYHLRYAVNVDNLLDDQKRYGLVYAPGRSAKFTVGMDF